MYRQRSRKRTKKKKKRKGMGERKGKDFMVIGSVSIKESECVSWHLPATARTWHLGGRISPGEQVNEGAAHVYRVSGTK